MAENIKTKSRGAKMLFASLSIAATMSGWAWLTANEATPQTNLQDIEVQEVDVTTSSAAVFVVHSGIGISVPLPPRASVPNLADLPVRGLREVGDAEFIPPPQSPQSQSQPPAVRQRQNNNGAQTQAQPQPKPKPKPVRKAKSSK